MKFFLRNTERPAITRTHSAHWLKQQKGEFCAEILKIWTLALRISERDKAVAIVFKATRHRIAQYRSNLANNRDTTDPINGFEWLRALIEADGANRINDITSCIKIPTLPLEKIEALRKLHQETFRGPAIAFPESWGIWRVAIA